MLTLRLWTCSRSTPTFLNGPLWFWLLNNNFNHLKLEDNRPLFRRLIAIPRPKRPSHWSSLKNSWVLVCCSHQKTIRPPLSSSLVRRTAYLEMSWITFTLTPLPRRIAILSRESTTLSKRQVPLSTSLSWISPEGIGNLNSHPRILRSVSWSLVRVFLRLAACIKGCAIILLPFSELWATSWEIYKFLV